ncbi:hypothetical protein C8R46DRAFT_1209291 [Mycena filopes]|nr:hypothetical protein C8R46DRAFT_1209291 [Mycena filopes]
MDSSALLAHIVSQTRQNVEFLISQQQISAADGRDILAKLPISMAALEQRTQNLLITPPPSTAPPYQPPTVQARALWGYNEGRVRYLVVEYHPCFIEALQDSSDLSFRAGRYHRDRLRNKHRLVWWTGRYNGKQGLFPSNYVEKLPSASVPSPYQARDAAYSGMPSFPSPNSQSQYQPPSGMNNQPPYQPPLVLRVLILARGIDHHHRVDIHNHQGGGGYQPAYQAPPPMGGPHLAQAPQVPPKKGKFGGLGNTLAQSAVGGVGFGAGSAVGSHIVNAIF